ncbi:TrbI/VirB10 family protein [Phenylobacterium sp.]|uniref:TrbI/VirB10 family protein n=1 Tax=Phenylobacterium sp. TaxID=1871053 RepID=UPI002F95F515
MSGPPSGDDDADLPLDRALSPVAGRLSGRRGRLMAVAGLGFGCVALAATAWRADRPADLPAPDTPARQVVAFESAAPLPAPAPEPAPEQDGNPATPRTRIPAPIPAPAPAFAPLPAMAITPTPPPPPPPPPLLAYVAQRRPDGPLAPRPMVAPERPTAPSELEALRQGSRIGGAAARRLSDRSFLILAGSAIPCILQTAIDTSTAGHVTCQVAADIWSDNGAVVLLDRGTRVLGEYRAGMRQGDRRVFVLWTRAVTPDGVAVDLASPGADALGRAGLGGEVDTRFRERFGAALLLSVVDEAAAAAIPRSDEAASIRLPSQAAAMAVEGSAGLRPTLRKAQGAEITILAAQDLDFSGVYGLEAREP